MLATGGDVEADVLLRAENLQKHFPVTEGLVLMRTVGRVRAVDGISFEVRRGQTLALVGESGCGKTTTARLVLRLETPTGGTISMEGQDIHALSGQGLRRFRTQVQAVFQDPWSSLSPRMRGGGDHRGAAGGQQEREPRRGARARAGAAGRRGPAPGAGRPLPARVQRWAAAAHRAGERAERRACADRARRARCRRSTCRCRRRS